MAGGPSSESGRPRRDARPPAGGNAGPAAPTGPHNELGDFVLLERIGTGGMGVVFKAQQRSLSRLVAVKVLSPRIAVDAEFIERFNREAKAAAALNHPNIVGAIAVGEAAGLHYFAMELLEGETARARLERDGPLPLADVLEIGRQTALALAHAHRKGILHRDIKPENLMLNEGREGLAVKVMDMGLARLERQDGSLTQEGIALGTPLYTSPEQARGARNVTAASDLYSLGATLFHLATGKPPFEGETAVAIMTQHVTDPPPHPQDINPELPDEFCALLLQLLAKDPEKRYESAEALAEDLQAAIEGRAAASAPAAGGKGPPRRLVTARAQPVLRRRTFRKHDRGSGSGALVPLCIALALAAIGGAGAYYYLYLPAKAQSSPEALKAKVEAEAAAGAAQAERKRLDGLLAAALQVEKEKPDDLAAQSQAWTELNTACAGRVHAALAVSKLDELSGKLANAAAEALGKALKESKQLTVERDYDAALAVLAAFSRKYPNAGGKEHIDVAVTAIRARGEAEGERLLKHAAELEAAGNRQGAVEAYLAAAGVKYAPVSRKAAAKAEALKAGRPAPKEKPGEQDKDAPAPAPEADEKEKAAVQAWDEAEALFVKKQYQDAQIAFLTFKADHRGTKMYAERESKLTLRLEALDILAGAKRQPGTQPAPPPKAPPPVPPPTTTRRRSTSM